MPCRLWLKSSPRLNDPSLLGSLMPSTAIPKWGLYRRMEKEMETTIIMGLYKDYIGFRVRVLGDGVYRKA